jgi:hypothetical protein
MADMFEKGKSYSFYFYYGDNTGFKQFSGQVVSYEHPFVKVDTKGLIRIINCSSSFSIEAISRPQSEEMEELVLEKDE